MRVRTWMTLHPTTITPDTTVLEARGILRRGGFRHCPVVHGGWLVGVVSDKDLTGSGRDVVGRVMSSPVCTAAPDDDLRSVAESLIVHRIHGMPVLGPDGLLIGMITTTDCLRALLQETPPDAPDTSEEAERRSVLR
jgi:acetoin utilization protein AcuB